MSYFPNSFTRKFPPVVVDVDLTLAKWNTVAVHRVFKTNGGLLGIRVAARVLVAGAGATATIQLGFTGATTNLIAATTITDFVADEMWYDATPTTKYDTPANIWLQREGVLPNVCFEIATAAATGGKIRFIAEWWSPDGSGLLSAGNGEAT